MEQSDDWKHRSLFDRQWVIRGFRKTAGMSAEEWLDVLARLEASPQGEGEIVKHPLQLIKFSPLLKTQTSQKILNI